MVRLDWLGLSCLVCGMFFRGIGLFFNVACYNYIGSGVLLLGVCVFLWWGYLLYMNMFNVG